jgi:hypothetical protein
MTIHFGMTLPYARSFAQRQTGASISGRIIDADSGKPVGDAIVFLSHTPLGISSRNDGRFVIANIPVGNYQLVISHVGYKQQIVSVQIAGSESLSYEIKLETEPVPIQVVEILRNRIGETLPTLSQEYHFFPKKSENTYCIYATAPSMPIGILFSDSGMYMYSLDTAVVDSEKYLRLWLLYENLSQTPYLLDPMRCARLHMQGKRRSYEDISPDWPTKMLASVDTLKAISDVSEKVGKSLKALGVVQTSVSSLEDYFTYWAGTTGPFHYVHGAFGPSRVGSLSADLYTVFSGGVNVGIMGRCTVYPKNSVNGYIYFPFPGLGWKVAAAGFSEASEYIYTIELITQTGRQLIQFIPQ